MQQTDPSNSNKPETVTLTKPQLQAILALLAQIEDGTSSLSLEPNSYHLMPHSALPSSHMMADMKPNPMGDRGSQSPKVELANPSYFYQKFNSVQDLSTGSGCQTPIGRHLISQEAPVHCFHVSPVQECNHSRLPTPHGNSPEFGRLTPVTSVPCFRRYHHRDNQDEWEQKRAKMLEYQSMLDQQNAEIARRKAEDKERKRKEDEALEKKLNEQRERMRMEYEEEQRRQRDREELMEKKRQDVIQAIEKTSHQMRESKKIACKGDTISLMSVDAVISATSSKVCDEQIKRTQSMYEVSSGDKEVQERKDKTFADVCIQTDYSLLLSWLFNMNERKDWESFLHQRDPVTTSSCPPEDDRKRSETRVAVSPKATQTECPDDVSSSSQTLSSLSPQPITYPIEKAKACGTKGSVSSKKPDYIEKAGAGGHQPQRPVVGQIRGRCKWNLSGSKPITKKGIGNSEEKDVQDARRRHAGIPYGNSSLISHEASSSSPGDSEKIIIPSEEEFNDAATGTSVTGSEDFFTIGSEYQLSLSSTSPSPCIDLQRKHRLARSPGRKGGVDHLPAIRKNSDEAGHHRKSLYGRKRWISQDDFGSGGTFVVDKNDGSCFSRVEEISPFP